MRRITWVVLCSCMLAAIALASSPARAGDYYYGDGYYGGGYRSSGYYNDGYSYRPRWHHRSVWYSSNCCYRKVVRHERSVRYVPEGYGYRSGYYDGGYYRRSYRSGYYERPYRVQRLRAPL